MKKTEVIEKLTTELERLYHNATLHNKLSCESDFEADLVQSQVEIECEMAFADLKHECPEILKYGKVYQYGRGGRTVAPTGLINQRGGSSFSIKSVDDLDLSYQDSRTLLKDLKKFNDHVEAFCRYVTDSAIEFIREEHSEEIKENEGKKRQHFSGVRYV